MAAPRRHQRAPRHRTWGQRILLTALCVLTVGCLSAATAAVWVYDKLDDIVRFGDANNSQLGRFAIPKFGPVPDDEFPLLVYMGLTKDGKRAKFLVDAALEVDGDGICRPHPASCEVIELAVGETEFLDVINPDTDTETTDEETISEDGTVETDEETEPEVLGTYQLDLVDIKRAGDSDVR